MKAGCFRIVPMRRSHIRACHAISDVSDPWKTLKERIDFLKYISLRQAYVCMKGDELSGFLLFTPEPVFARGGYLRALGVAPSMRGRGIGRRLMSIAEKETARCSQCLYLCVSSFNRPAQAFYKNLGYVRAGKLTGLIIPGASEYIYWKRLKPITRDTRRLHGDQ